MIGVANVASWMATARRASAMTFVIATASFAGRKQSTVTHAIVAARGTIRPRP